jgi:hypothetical protein
MLLLHCMVCQGMAMMQKCESLEFACALLCCLLKFEQPQCSAFTSAFVQHIWRLTYPLPS